MCDAFVRNGLKGPLRYRNGKGAHTLYTRALPTACLTSPGTSAYIHTRDFTGDGGARGRSVLRVVRVIEVHLACQILRIAVHIELAFIHK